MFLCDVVLANVLIMEVTAYTPWKLEERMKIRAELKKTNPDCKIVLVVDENTEKKLADKVPRMRLTLVMVMELLPATAMRGPSGRNGFPRAGRSAGSCNLK